MTGTKKSPNGEYEAPKTGVEISGLEREEGFDPEKVLEPLDKIFTDQMSGNYETLDALLTDSQVNSCYQQRELAVTSRETEVVAGGTESESTTDKELDAAEQVKAYIKDLNWDEITALMLRSNHYGFRIAELLWLQDGTTVPLPKIKVRRNQWFKFGPDQLPRLITPENPDGEKLPPQNFWWITSGASHGDDPYGVGGSALYWLVKFKQQALKAWLGYLETLKVPVVLGVHRPNASPSEKRSVLDAVTAIANGAKAATVSDDSVIKFLEVMRSGTADYQSLIEMMDAAIAKVILSQTMTTDNGSSRSQAEVHYSVRKEITEADAALIDDSFNRHVIAPWCFYNYGPDVRPPRVRRRLEEKADLAALAETDERLAKIGWVRSEASMEETYGSGYVFVGAGNSAGPVASDLDVQGGVEPFEDRFEFNGLPKFAEGEPEKMAIDLVAERLADEAGPIVDQWIEQVRGRLMEAPDLPTFAEGLHKMFPDMPPGEFVGLMEQAFAVSRAGGAYDAATEAE